MTSMTSIAACLLNLEKNNFHFCHSGFYTSIEKFLVLEKYDFVLVEFKLFDINICERGLIITERGEIF